MTNQLRALRQSDEQDILAVSDAALLRAIPDSLLVVDRAGHICLHHAGSERNCLIDQAVDNAELLFELAADEREAQRALRRVRRWEAWRTWLRAGRILAEGVYVGSMSLVYVLAAPLALLVRAVRPTPSGWRER